MSKKGKRRKKKHRKKQKYQKRLSGRNRHHLVPKSRGGKASPDNLLWMDIEKHACWHKIFGNRTLTEVIRLLQRIRRMKKGQAK